MLTSSDAKWRCLWHLLIWSLLLTFVSQLLDLKDHIAFYILASLSVLILPVLTAVYCNTSGRKGAGLLRVAYVILDPVIACLTITPVKLVNHMPSIMNRSYCWYHFHHNNSAAACLQNLSFLQQENISQFHSHSAFLNQQTKSAFLVLQSCVLLPVVFAFFMGRRSHKMSYNTLILSFVYWFISALEAVSLLETALLWEAYQHTVHTTEIIVSIAVILANSYAIITLCSYITPSSQTEYDTKKPQEKFDFIYQFFVGVAGVFFTEVPFIVARLQIILVDVTVLLPGTFYFWMVKDFLFIVLILTLLVLDRYGHKLINHIQIPCQPEFDNKVFFKPEKRDVYIQRKRKVHFREPLEEDENDATTNTDALNCGKIHKNVHEDQSEDSSRSNGQLENTEVQNVLLSPVENTNSSSAHIDSVELSQFSCKDETRSNDSDVEGDIKTVSGKLNAVQVRGNSNGTKRYRVQAKSRNVIPGKRTSRTTSIELANDVV